MFNLLLLRKYIITFKKSILIKKYLIFYKINKKLNLIILIFLFSFIFIFIIFNLLNNFNDCD